MRTAADAHVQAALGLAMARAGRELAEALGAPTAMHDQAVARAADRVAALDAAAPIDKPADIAQQVAAALAEYRVTIADEATAWTLIAEGDGLAELLHPEKARDEAMNPGYAAAQKALAEATLAAIDRGRA